MIDSPKTRVAILGGGRGGTALLDLFEQLPEIELVGVADKDPQAPALARARAKGIPVTDKAIDLIRHPNIHLIVDVTGDPELSPLIAQHKAEGTEVLGGAASKLLWHIVRYATQMQTQLFQAEKLATIGTFASGIAHDINNPLYLIMGLAENLLDETDISRVQEQAKDILGAVKRIAAICQNLTHYARQSSAFDTTNVDLNAKLDEALTIAKYATIPKDLSVAKHYGPNAVIAGKPEEILQVFVNLITNALHAMDGKGQLTLSSECRNGKVWVHISDTGCGIPPEHFEKIFDPFFTTKPRGKGTGLGLHSVKAIVNKYQGHLSLSSEVGKGTTFHIEFPSAVTT